MSNTPVILAIPFIMLLGSCTTVYNINDNRTYDNSKVAIKHEQRNQSTNTVVPPASETQATAKPVAKAQPDTKAKSAPQQIVAGCSVYLMGKMEEVVLTKEMVKSAKTELELVNIVMEHTKALEKRIKQQNEATDRHNRVLRECVSK